MGAINIMINDNYTINQGAVLVIMSAILSTLTSVSLHYDHSPLALPMEVGHHPQSSPQLTCCWSFIVQSHNKSQILIPFVQSFAIVLLLYSLSYSFCIPFVQVFQFDFNPIQSYFLNPIVFPLLSNSLYQVVPSIRSTHNHFLFSQRSCAAALDSPWSWWQGAGRQATFSAFLLHSFLFSFVGRRA